MALVTECFTSRGSVGPASRSKKLKMRRYEQKEARRHGKLLDPESAWRRFSIFFVARPGIGPKFVTVEYATDA